MEVGLPKTGKAKEEEKWSADATQKKNTDEEIGGNPA